MILRLQRLYSFLIASWFFELFIVGYFMQLVCTAHSCRTKIVQSLILYSLLKIQNPVQIKNIDSNRNYTPGGCGAKSLHESLTI